VIPERRMHAKGSGAHGSFTVTHDISRYTRAKIFAEIGKQPRCSPASRRWPANAPGCAVHPGRHAIGHHPSGRGRRAPIDRNAADRNGTAELACFEPAYVDELAVCLRWAFDYIQRSGQSSLDPDDEGGSVYLRLTTRPIAQPQRQLAPLNYPM
jgi:hypothetical protein